MHQTGQNNIEDKYYFIRDPETNKPVVTVCNLKKDKQIIATGLATCSDYDNPFKMFGKDLALRRAKAAMNAKRNLFPIKIMDVVLKLDTLIPCTKEVPSFKGLYCPLT